jgi:DNA repair protein RecO (recombination protein O)
MPLQRITHEPAFVLHSYPWSESSLIVELLTRQHGRVAVVAKGVKRPSSQFRSILLPLQLLSVAYSRGDELHTEVGTLKAAEWQGGHTMPVGEALLSGYYLNELVMKLLARDDPHTSLFDAYREAVAWLRDSANMQASLRAFELILLREIGFLPALHIGTLSNEALSSDVLYSLSAELGLRETAQAHSSALSGAVWQALGSALQSAAPIFAVRHLVQSLEAADRQALKQQLRQVLQHHSGSRGLRTRMLMRDVQSFV